MKLASYIAKHGNIIDKLIALRHLGRYSHSEAYFDLTDGRSWSSSNRDNGVRWKTIEFDKKWELVELPVTAEQEARIAMWCEAQVGRAYDWSGVFTFVNPFRRHKESDLFCCEAVVCALQTEGFFAGVDSWKVWPSRLHQMAKELRAGVPVQAPMKPGVETDLI